MSTPGPSPIPEPADWDKNGYLFSVEYKKRDDDSRHFSNIRSALTTFLVTVGLGSLVGYFSKDHPTHPAFFWIIGVIFFGAAILACFVFSWRTQCSDLQVRRLWKWATGATKDDGSKAYSTYPEWKTYGKLEPEEKSAVWKRIRGDWMNRALLLAIFFIGAAFTIFAVWLGPPQVSEEPCEKCNQRTKCSRVQFGDSYAIAISSSAAAAQAYAEAAAIARDAAKTYADSTKAGGGACCCAITVNCGESCPKTHSHTKHHN